MAFPPAAAPPAPPLADKPEDIIRAVAKAQGIDPDFALSIAQTESSMNPQTPPSNKGAIGLMQLMPATAARHKVNASDPYENALGGVMELRDLHDTYGGDLEMMARRYNGHGPDTTDYARKVLTEYERRKGFAPGTLTSQLSPNDPGTTGKMPTKPAAATGAQPRTAPGGPPPPPTFDPGWEAQHPVSTMVASMINNEPVPAQATPGEAAIYRAGAGTAKFLKEATQSLNPVNIAKGVGALFTTSETPTEKTLTLDPRPALQSMWDANAKLRDEGKQLMDKARGTHDFGKSLEGLGRIAEGMIPVFGPRLAEADKYLRSGEYAKGAGALTDVAGQTVGPAFLDESQVTPRLFKPRLTDAEQAAVDLGMRTPKLPMDVATATGSTFARQTQRGVEATPIGGAVHEVVKSGRQKALPALGEDLAAGVHPVPVSPEQAGVGIRTGVEDYIARQHATANTNYDTLRQIEQDPALAQSVQVGTRKDWAPDGTLVDTPIMETMPLPAAVVAAKPTLRALYDRVMQAMPLAQREASPGLQALKQTLDGPDYVPASVLDRNLSAIKDLARGADLPQLRDVSQGLAAKAVSELEKVHADAIQRAGPQAQQALTAGRAATKAKWAAQDVLDKVTRAGAEPVSPFRGATVAGDAAVEHLRDLQRLAPAEIPKMGRAVLDTLFDRASGLEQGWGRADSVANKWEALGPQTKQILFGGRAADLDSFFLLSKMLARTPNPSGSALTALAAASGWGLATHPLTAAPTILGSGAMAALMNSRLGIQLLTKGLKIPAGGVQAAAWLTTVGEQLRKVRQDVGLPPPLVPGRAPADAPPPAPDPSWQRYAPPRMSR